MQFKDVVGQERIKEMLVGNADQNRVSHAQLFSGKSGSGGLPLAVAYAQYLNCTDRRGGDSCGVCSSCHKMNEVQHPDVHFVVPMLGAASDKGESQLRKLLNEMSEETNWYFNESEWYGKLGTANQQGIINRKAVEEVIQKLSFKSFQSKYKIVIVWLPERMHATSANVMLKILEEPWENTLFLMVSEAPNQLLPTISSRLQEIQVPAIDAESMRSHLAVKYNLQGRELEDVVRLAKGDITASKMVVEREGDATNAKYFELFTTLMRLSYLNRHMELFDWADSVIELGREQQREFLDYSVGMLRENYMINAGMEEITYLWGKELSFSQNFSPYIGNHNIEKLVEEFEQAKLHVMRNGNPRLIFPHFALEVSKHIGEL